VFLCHKQSWVWLLYVSCAYAYCDVRPDKLQVHCVWVWGGGLLTTQGICFFINPTTGG